jgi:translation elongation factor P/translation initiation factor 5A
MKTKHLQIAALVLLPAAMLGLSSCSSTSALPGQHSATVTKTSTGTTVVGTFKTAATVTAVDANTRKLKLTMSNGERTTVKCGPEVKNFSQIHIHDRIVVTATQQIAAYLDKGKVAGSSGTTTVKLAPQGAKPGVVVAETSKTTVKVTAIDAKARKVTLQTQEGKSETIKVGDHIDLTKVKVGDTVTISKAESVAVSVTKS